VVGSTALLPIALSLTKVFAEVLTPSVAFLNDQILPTLSERFKQIGDFVVNDVVPAFQTYFLPTLKLLAEFVQENLIPAFLAFVGFIKNTIIPIILSVAIPIFNGLADVFAIVIAKVEENRESFIKLFRFLGEFFTVIKERIAPVVGVVLKVAFEILAKAIGPAIDIIFKFIDAFASIGSFLVKVANGVLGTIEAMVNGIIAGVNLAISVLNKLPGVDIGTQDAINISLPTISAPTAPGASGGGFNPINADRIASPAFTGTSPGLALPGLPASSGGSSGGSNGDGRVSILPVPDYRDPGTGDLDNPFVRRIAAMESAQTAASSTVNITVNTVTADAELPNLIVESLQRNNLISGPLDISIAV
jgi:hypothetical protein